MATGKKAAKKRRTNVDVEEEVVDDLTDLPDTDELDEVEEPTDDDLNDEIQEDDEVAAASEKAKTRVKNVEPDEDEVADEDEVDEEVDEDSNSFAPYIAHKDQEWEVSTLFEEAEEGATIIVYDMDNERWYKFLPITVGEVGE